MPIRIQLAACLALTSVLQVRADIPDFQRPDFQREVRPILSDHCFACHGPDPGQRQADLRLDTAAGMASVIEPADLESSELVRRLDAEDADEIMPPPEFHKDLSPRQRQILKAWVSAGAKYETHWAFDPPLRPEVKADGSPIDYFLNRRLAQVDLTPNEIADRRTLLRRLCLDLTGLPPTRGQLNEFLADHSADAVERLVDRLLASRHYGQHMARYWLDTVRYADTHGLHLDNYREMWPYRDWVIKSFNENLPFDRFVTEQLAGDLFPDATRDQLVASGFNRLNVTTNEGGSIYDEVFARNVIDRTDAFGTVFLGLTTGCAVCHDHKFDPLTMRDYYSLSAFFNSLDGRAMDDNIKNPAPVISVPTADQEQRLQEFDVSLAEIRQQMRGPIESVDAAQAAWERELIQPGEPKIQTLIPVDVSSAAGVEMKVGEDGSIAVAGEPADKDTTTIVAKIPPGVSWQTLRLEALTETDDGRVGLSENGNVVLSEITVETSAADQDDWTPVPIRYAVADIEQTDGPFAVSYAIDEKEHDREGWAVGGHQQTGPRNAWFVMPALVTETEAAGSKIRIRLAYQSIFQAHQFRRLRLSLSEAGPVVPENQQITLGQIHSVGPFPIETPKFGYNRDYASINREFNAQEVFTHTDRPYRWQQRDDLPEVEVNQLPIIADRPSVTILHHSIQAPRAQQVTLLLDTDDGHMVYLNGKNVGTVRGPHELAPLSHQYELNLQQGANRLYIKVVNHAGPSRLTFAYRAPAVPVPAALVQLIRTDETQREQADREAIRSYYRQVYCLHPDWLALVDLQQGMLAAKQKVEAEMSTTLVWKELDQPRAAHILKRGQYDQPGEAVPRATPAFLPPLPEDAPLDRLGLAQWLVSPDHPLTARVYVNRVWQQLFGIGLVQTSEDFGSQGQPPTHPELLDWLAVDFRDSGWDVKRLVKMLVMSDAYQRSAHVTPRMLELDPDNRLLARGPRYRLDAEVIRDQALAISGLLNDKPGGPSVKPPQPDGLWLAVGYTRSNTARFTADVGDKIYRRSVYIFWKRTSPPPQMSILDAPSRESCTAHRERTNTPLQALLLLNETQLFQAAKHLADRVLEQTELTETRARIDWLFETVTMRVPDQAEAAELVALADDLTQLYRDNDAATKQIDASGSPELAAWTVVANTVLNLDEVVNK
jgi:hypothetical protein